MLVKAIVARIMMIIMRLRITRLPGVCRSLKAFLKSFIIRLKAKVLLEVEDIEEAATDMLFAFSS